MCVQRHHLARRGSCHECLPSAPPPTQVPSNTVATSCAIVQPPLRILFPTKAAVAVKEDMFD
jgi:hypothetical protein